MHFVYVFMYIINCMCVSRAERLIFKKKKKKKKRNWANYVT